MINLDGPYQSHTFESGQVIYYRIGEEVEYYMNGHRITNEILIYEIEQCIAARTNDEL